MRLQTNRFTSDDDSTIGVLRVVGDPFRCFTCEDEFRLEKKAAETRIPPGQYELKLRTVGGFHERYLAKFGPQFHKGMLWLQNVPGFEYVLIHMGNTQLDTAGCLLVGMTANLNDAGGGSIANSEVAYRKLYPRVRDALLRGEQVFIDISDDDRE